MTAVSPSTPRRAHESGVPVVTCGKPLGHESAHAAADDRSGARLVVEHLRSRGRRRIATITGPTDTPGGVERLAADRAGGPRLHLTATPLTATPPGRAAHRRRAVSLAMCDSFSGLRTA